MDYNPVNSSKPCQNTFKKYRQGNEAHAFILSSCVVCCAGGRVLSILIELEQVLTDALQQAFPGLEERALVAPCRDAKFGDYQCNNAMALFAKMKGKVIISHPLDLGYTQCLLQGI